MNIKFILLALAASSLMAAGADYTFNSGGSEGWTYHLYDDSSTFLDVRSGSARWSDLDNYPSYLTDPVGDSKGAAQVEVTSSDYNTVDSTVQYLVLDFESPDLTASADWQSASTFSAKVLPSFTGDAWTPDVYANLFVVINDLDTGTERTFVSGSATPISSGTWTPFSFDLSSTFAAYHVVHYQVVQVIVRFWIAVASGRGVSEPLVFAIDDVAPDCGAVVYSDEEEFLAAAGPTTIYGFESNGLSEDVNELTPSPVPASDLAGNFDMAYTHLNAFNVQNLPGSICNVDGDRSLVTHSMVADNYSLTFSNFGGENRKITAFGLTVCDFASGLTEPATITYDTGTESGTLLVVPRGQADYTKNFIGVVVCPDLAFSSITLTFDDNDSGFQWFDRVIYSGESRLRFRSINLDPILKRVILKWFSGIGLHYTIEYSTDLKHWFDLADVPSQGAVTTFMDNQIGFGKKFYRIRQNLNAGN